MEAAFTASVPVMRTTRSLPGRCPRMCAEPEKPDAPKAEAGDSTASGDEEKKVKFFKPIRTVKSSASWKYEFIDVFGQKGPGSRPLWDMRPVSHIVKDKESNGNVKCDFCKGTGLQVCSFCEGVEFMQDGKLSKCPGCDGKKNVTCSTCFGTTKQIELVGNWWTKGVAALFQEK